MPDAASPSVRLARWLDQSGGRGVLALRDTDERWRAIVFEAASPESIWGQRPVGMVRGCESRDAAITAALDQAEGADHAG